MKQSICRSCFAILLLAGLINGCYVGGQHLNRLNTTVSVSPHTSEKALTIAVSNFDTTTEEQYKDGLSTYTPEKTSGVRMADVVSTKLVDFPAYKVIERSRLKQILGELKLHMADLVEPKNLKEVGKLLSVDALVLGRTEGWRWVNQFGWGTSLDASFRLVDVETGEIIWSSEGSIIRINSTENLYETLSSTMLKELSQKLNAKG